MSPTDDFDLDVGAYVRAVGRLWWLVILLALVGAAAGYGIAKLSTHTYTATSAVYLGQPTDANGNAIVGVSSNPRAAQQIVSGSDVLQQAVAQLHGEIKVGALRRGLSTTFPTVLKGSTAATPNYVAISVTSRSAKKSAAAANALAQILVARLGAFSTAKIDLLEQQITAAQAQLDATNARLAAAQKQLAAAGGASSPAAATYLAVVQAASTQQQTLQSTLQSDKLSLLVARNVEMPAVITTAVSSGSAHNTPRLRSSVAGGFFAGIVVALVIAAFTMRRRPKAQPAAAADD